MRNNKVVMSAVLLLVIIAGGVFLFFTIFRGNTSTLQKNQDKDVVVKIGNENIYKSDIEKELALYPKELVTNTTEEDILKKLKTDSVILQGGAEEGIINLDGSFFNSKDKLYEMRLQNIEKVKAEVNKRAGGIKGEIVTIWFYNTVPAKIGLERGKQVAFTKISEIYKEVRDNKLTMKQAGDRIAKDTSLADVDEAYMDNAYVVFTNKPTDPVVFDKSFDEKLRSVPIGQVTEIHLATRVMKQGEQPREMAYMFGKVLERTGGESYDQWIQKYEDKYK